MSLFDHHIPHPSAVRANVLLSKGTRRPLYSQILKIFISYLSVASLCSRIAIKWPTAVLNLMRLQSVAGAAPDAIAHGHCDPLCAFRPL